jgi:hypothetical protein
VTRNRRASPLSFVTSLRIHSIVNADTAADILIGSADCQRPVCARVAGELLAGPLSAPRLAASERWRATPDFGAP